MVQTGNIVRGTVPGLRNQKGLAVVYTAGTPAGSVWPAPQGSSPSGACIAYDYAADQLYRNTSGGTWIKLGSVQ